ncbi:MAG: DUF533 domain-containing protein [Gammaproteobacteria bacterium]|jgi:hypothetical protein|nr:DUF533 domain-containing protein [Gammaproteobacteria bacterium]
MITASLRKALADLKPWVSREYGYWWRSWTRAGRRRLEVFDEAPGLHGSVVDTLAAALLAERGAANVAGVLDERFGDDPALCCAVRLRLRRPAPGVHQIVDGIDDGATALAVYLAAVYVIDGSAPAGRVWLEDLAEALLVPPILMRQLHRYCEVESPLRLAVSA